jgi:hypothetical protein
MKYGYARVSTDGQSIDAQVRQLKVAGARQVFREVASGGKTDRAQLRRAIAQLDAGVPCVPVALKRIADRLTIVHAATPVFPKEAGLNGDGKEHSPLPPEAPFRSAVPRKTLIKLCSPMICAPHLS